MKLLLNSYKSFYMLILKFSIYFIATSFIFYRIVGQ